MTVDSITFEGIMLGAAVLLAAIGAYNQAMQARKHQQEAERRRAEPLAELRATLEKHTACLDADRRTLEAHNRRLDDTRTGLMAVCAGVQALLGHELLGGNTPEMEEASRELARWLRERPRG